MGSINIAYGSTGTVTHKNEDIVWGGIYDLEHQTWTITTEADFDLDPVKYYWVYIKSNVDDGTALWYLSESKIQALDVEGYYMFEWGQINPVREGSRILQPAYGSSYKMHNPVTVNPASAAYASIDPATQELTVNEQAGGGGTNYFPDTITSETGNVQADGKHTHELGSVLSEKIIMGYGSMLYNFHSIIDSRNIAPVGWHVPTIYEWYELLDHIDIGAYGIWPNAGGYLKANSIYLWRSPNIGATNDYEFSSIGTGTRSEIGFGGYKETTVYHSYDNLGSNNQLAFSIHNYTSEIRVVGGAIYLGGAVRLIKDDDIDDSTMVDNDGNTCSTIKIGDQVWMAEDLYSTKYRNGNSIIHAQKQEEWND